MKIESATLRTFIAGLDIPEDARRTLLDLSPATYTGLAERLARNV